MEWISVKDRLPTIDECERFSGWFLVYRDFGNGYKYRPEMSRYDGHDEEHSYDHGWKFSIDDCITHWQELPDIDFVGILHKKGEINATKESESTPT